MFTDRLLNSNDSLNFHVKPQRRDRNRHIICILRWRANRHPTPYIILTNTRNTLLDSDFPFHFNRFHNLISSHQPKKELDNLTDWKRFDVQRSSILFGMVEAIRLNWFRFYCSCVCVRMINQIHSNHQKRNRIEWNWLCQTQFTN